MSFTSTPPNNAAVCWSVPSKIFLLGEYHVLSGGSGLLVTLAPRFECVQSDTPELTEGRLTRFHADSPVGRLLEFAKKTGIPADFFGRLQWQDPYSGSGGLGASTAQFAMAYGALAEVLDWDRRWESVWKLYRELTVPARGFSPSGADLVAQWKGGAVALVSTQGQGIVPWRARDVFPFLDSSLFLIFKSPRKVATHAHLAESGEPTQIALAETAPPFEALMERAFDAIEDRAWATLGQCFSQYADQLNALGLENPESHLDRQTLQGIPGVLGVKGSGAQLADTIVILVEPGTVGSVRSTIIHTAEARGLQLISDGLRSEMGIQRKCL